MDANLFASFLYSPTCGLICAILVLYLVWQWTNKSILVDIRGRNVLITGGSSGIGLELARLVLQRGANVTILARNLSRLTQAKAELKPYTMDDATISIISLDLGSSFDVIEETISSKIETVDILIHCAGFAVARTFIDTPVAAFADLINANYLGPVHVTKALLPRMLIPSQDGPTLPTDRRIAFFSSMGGQISIYGYSAYTGSKFAIRGFADVLRQELEKTGPLVTVVYPSDTKTPGLEVENEGKPSITKIISGSGGLASPTSVASRALHDILIGKRQSVHGFAGLLLSLATTGVSMPHESVMGPFLSAVMEIITAPILRLFSLLYACWMELIISRN